MDLHSSPLLVLDAAHGMLYLAVQVQLLFGLVPLWVALYSGLQSGLLPKMVLHSS